MDLVTISALRTRAMSAADMIGSQFVVTSEWNAWLNYGARRLHDLLCSTFGDDYLIKSTTLTTVAGQNYVTLPNDFYRERAIDYGSGSNAISLRRMAFKDRNKYNWANIIWGGVGAVPFYTISGNRLMLFPAPSSAGANLVLWYYPTLQLTNDGGVSWLSTSIAPDTSTDAYAIDGVNGFEELIVLEAAIRAKLKEDTDPDPLIEQRNEVLSWIQEAARNRNSGQPAFVGEMRDDGGFFSGDGGAFFGG